MLVLLALAIAVSPTGAVEERLLQEAGEVQLAYPLHTKVEVSPGQQFYGEYREVTRERVAYRVAAPFKSSMAGSMGFPFAFAIDETDLVPSHEGGGWTYYIPRRKQFRAWHGVLGNVLAEGDTVGLRVHRDGRKEWFVDNSRHNGMRTVWTRKLKSKDPAMTEVPFATRSPVGPVHTLIYLGVSSGQVRVRHEQMHPDGSLVRDEYEYPIEPGGTAMGAVMGATFKIEAKPTGATVEMLKPMSGSSGSVTTSLLEGA